MISSEEEESLTVIFIGAYGIENSNKSTKKSNCGKERKKRTKNYEIMSHIDQNVLYSFVFAAAMLR
jgi:hypothetical protein